MEMDRGRRAGTELCVALLDLNQFKRINDAHGHAAGDDVLLSVAETLSEAIRETDVAGRFGGDEFILLFPDTTAAEAEEVLDYLRDLEIAVSAREGFRARISFSWGIASWPGGGRWPRCGSNKSASSSALSSRSTASRSKSRTSSSRCWWDPRDAARPPASAWSQGWRRRARATSTSASAS